MLVELEKAEISGNLQAENSMQVEIGNVEIVTSILADRLYNDKVRIVLQEYACNARDAHREAGCPDRPIEIDLPGALEPTLKIRDFGPGMSPDRVHNVFRLLGNSTKRGDNTQTGGFGIGAKCGYAYHTRTFTVVTVHDGIQYTYHCYRAGTGKFMMDLLGQEETDKESGTEIQIPTDAGDHKRFRDYASWMFEDWSVRPILNLSVLPDHDVLHAAADGSWEFRKSAVSFSSVVASVDGIPYDTGLRYASNLYHSNQLILRFEPGELTLAANRESLETTKDNTALLELRLEAALKELRQGMSDRYFDPNVPLFTQLSKGDLQALLNLRLVKLPDDLPWPVPYGDIGVDAWTCYVTTRGWGNHAKVRLEDWADRAEARYSRGEERTLLFTTRTPIGTIKEYVRNGNFRNSTVAMMRLRGDSNVALLNRYHDVSDIIDLPTVKAERAPQPKGRVTVMRFDNGRFRNQRVFTEELQRCYWTELAPDLKLTIATPAGEPVELSFSNFFRLKDSLDGLPALSNVVIVTDKLKKLTAGRLSLTEQHVEQLQKIDFAYRLTEAIGRIGNRKFALPRPTVTALLKRYNTELAGVWERRDKMAWNAAVFSQLFEQRPMIDLTPLARAVYRMHRVCKKNEAVRTAISDHRFGCAYPAWDELMDLLYTHYFKDVLEA